MFRQGDLSTENASVAVLRRFYRAAAERRGNMALAAPLAAAMCNDRLTLPMLTYISIGFVSNLIYAEENFGADHNMLLIGRVWAHRDLPISELARACCGQSLHLRTIATKCCHSVA
jgi:hypothetical protein